MQGILNQSGPTLKLRVETIDDKVDTGLAIFGGGLSGSRGCDDMYKVVNISPKGESIPLIIERIDEITNLIPSGSAGI